MGDNRPTKVKDVTVTFRASTPCTGAIGICGVVGVSTASSGSLSAKRKTMVIVYSGARIIQYHATY